MLQDQQLDEVEMPNNDLSKVQDAKAGVRGYPSSWSGGFLSIASDCVNTSTSTSRT